VFKQAWASVFLGGLSLGSLRGGLPLSVSPCPAFVDAVCAAYVATAEAGQAPPDALALMAASNVAAPYDQVNPYCFEPAISPHIAAEEACIAVDTAQIRSDFDTLAASADVIVVEGAGGWLAPLGPHISIKDLATTLDLPVLLVVGVRLGCINHALLTKLAIESHVAQFAGWIANTIDPGMPRQKENLETLARQLGVAPLAVVPALAATAAPLALHEAATRLFHPNASRSA